MDFKNPVVTQFAIYYPNGQVAIQLGPGATMTFYDQSGNLIMEISPPRTAYEVLIQIMQGNIEFLIANNVNQTSGVGFEWSNGNGEVFANVIPDGNNILQLGLNGAPYTNGLGQNVRERIFMRNGNFEIGQIVATTQTETGAHLNLLTQSGFLQVWNNGVQPSLGGLEFFNSGNQTVMINSGETWHTASLNAGYTSAANFEPAQFRMMPDGTVMMRGTIVGTGANIANGTLFTLPSGYIPGLNLQFPSAGNDPNPLNVMRIQVTGTTGAVVLVGASATATSCSLDGMSFAVNI